MDIILTYEQELENKNDTYFYYKWIPETCIVYNVNGRCVPSVHRLVLS